MNIGMAEKLGVAGNRHIYTMIDQGFLRYRVWIIKVNMDIDGAPYEWIDWEYIGKAKTQDAAERLAVAYFQNYTDTLARIRSLVESPGGWLSPGQARIQKLLNEKNLE